MTATAEPVAPVERPFARDHHAMLVLLFTACVLAILSGDRLPLGFVWDPDWYIDHARHLPQRLFVEGLNGYRIQRILPSALVWTGLAAVEAEHSAANAMRGFIVLDLALLLLSCATWRRIADLLGIGRGARWLGFLGLFANYAILKHAFYMPAMTEIAAFALGVLAFRFYLERRRWALVGVGVAGGFVFPTVAPGVALLLLWSRGSADAPPDEAGRWATPVAAAAAVGVVALFLVRYLVLGHRTAGYGPITPVVDALVPLSIAATFAHVFLGTRMLVEGVDPAHARRLLRVLRPQNVAMALLTIALPAVVVRALQVSSPTVVTPRIFLTFTTFLPNTRPWLQMVAHVAWFGPVVLLVVLHWRQLARLAWRLGPSVPAALAFAFFVAMTPESRQSSFAYPMIVALGVTAVDRHRAVDRALLAIVGIASMVLSHAWRRLTTAEMLASPPGPVLDNERAATLFREYFVQNGPWMPNDAYALHVATILPVAAALALWVRSRRRHTHPAGLPDRTVA